MASSAPEGVGRHELAHRLHAAGLVGVVAMLQVTQEAALQA
jgi:hypothetical protein